MKVNKKKLMANILLVLFLYLSIFPGSLAAQNSAASPGGQKIQELKEKLASRVAELNVISQKVIRGPIKTLSDQKIILSVGADEITANLSDDTEFYLIDENFVKKRIKLDDFKNEQMAFTYGAFNTSTKTVSAKEMVIMEIPMAVTGKIKSIDKKNFQITVSSVNKDYLVDIDQITKTSQYDKNKGVLKSGFSKFAEGQEVLVYGVMTTSKDGKELLPAKRVLILASPDLTN